MIAVSAAFLVLVVRLWQLQVISGKELRKESEENRLRVVDIYAPRGIIYDRNGIPLVKNMPNFSVSVIPERLKTANIQGISALLGLDPAWLTRTLAAASRSVEPVKIKDDLSFDDLARVEARLSDFPELTVDVGISRDYIYGQTAAHLIGYIGRLTPAQAESPEYAGVSKNSFAGQWGIEKLYDKQLRGVDGKKLIEVDAMGREIKQVGEVPPKKGQDLTLALDIKMQMAAETAFANHTGAFVAINPNTGEILGFMSKPSFDTNEFVPSISAANWKALIMDDKQPMLDRVFQSAYPPGSTFKIITAMTGLETGIINTGTKFNCPGFFDLGNHVWHCWRHRGHGDISVHNAIVQSCDVFFYNVGIRTGIDPIAKYAKAFGLGRKVGLGLGPESSGLIPDTQWKEDVRKQKWYPGESLNCAIGQGYVLVTPLQMARMIGAVGTGGTFMPKLTFLKQPANAKPVDDPIPVHISQNTIDIIKSALAGVVNDPAGTAYRSRSSIVSISGKTGTAQVAAGVHAQTNAWFVAYAPSAKPEVALAVVAEKAGEGASSAAPVAKAAIEAYMKDIHPELDKTAAQKAGKAAIGNGASMPQMPGAFGNKTGIRIKKAPGAPANKSGNTAKNVRTGFGNKTGIPVRKHAATPAAENKNNAD